MLAEEASDRAFAKVDDPTLLLRHTAHAGLIGLLAQDWGFGVNPLPSTSSSSGVGSSGSGALMPMTAASQRVSGKVPNIKTTKIVSGAARNASGPPSSHAQKINPMKRIVGERLSPRPISIGESAFSARMLITMTPAMTSNALS